MYSITLRRVIALSFDEILRTDLWTSLLTKSNLIRPSARRNNRLIPSNLIELASRTWPLRSINSAISNRTFIFLVHNYRRPSVPNITDCSVSRIITSSDREDEVGKIFLHVPSWFWREKSRIKKRYTFIIAIYILN